MTDLRKAAEMALEALEWYVDEDDVIEFMAGNELWVEGKRKAEKSIQALRQALAQPVDAVNTSQERVDETAKGEHEPVAWGIANTRPTEKNPLMDVMLYEPEPSHLVVPLYTVSPKKEWVGLTTAEVIQCQEAYYYDTYANIEAKLKEKNGG